jgi:protein SCO1/2
MRLVVLAALVLLTLLANAGAQELPKQIEAVKFDQRLGEQVPLDAQFRAADGTVVQLGDLVQGKPVVLVLAYYRCPRLCSVVINNVIDGLAEIPPEAGKDYQVVIISFDPEEMPELAAQNKELAVGRYGRGPAAAAGWHFLTGQEHEIKRVADAVGFHYVYNPDAKVYKHGAGIMILTPQGKVARYLFGVSFAPQDLRLALLEASEGRISAPADQVLLLTCLAYDPASGKYTLAVFKIVRLAALVTVLFLGLYVWRNFSRERRARKVRAGGATITPDSSAAEHNSPGRI